MPLNRLSDRQLTVAYGSDLLRAHQICRENIILQKQLEACLEQVVGLCEEVRGLEANYTTAVEDERAARSLLEAQVQTLISDCQKGVEVEQQREQHVQVTLESFRIALDEKADASVVESLANRVDQLHASSVTVNATLPPVSRVSDSIQVLDSQQYNHHKEPSISAELSNRLEVHHGPRETVPDDLDLDANAETISYAGHHQCLHDKNDSLRMLPPPPAEATQLARIKSLRQRRFDEWTSYYDQGQRLLESLPNSFEETVVHNFVSGILRDSHRRQCQQWLDANGWTWANVTTFGILCSQVLANNAIHPEGTTQALSSAPSQTDDMPATACANDKTESRTDSKKAQKPKTRRVTGSEPLRRSQRLLEHRLNASSHSTPALESMTLHPPKAIIPNSSVLAVDQGTNTQLDRKSEARPKMKKPQPKLAGNTDVQKARQPRPENDSAEGRKPAGDDPPTEHTRQSESHSGRKRAAESNQAVHPKKRPKSKKEKAKKRKDAECRVLSAKPDAAKVAAESSDDEGFLYEANPSEDLDRQDAGDILRKRSHDRRSGHGVARQYRTDRWQKRLPLPPPPEIPILPTTDEE
ncbi:hypothetical protein CLCR_08320 [Cladophialophora carrionii]|uniref:Uncharacterized protein n=1 Tax=Cladophialophora carrionii TaxID=86049 RepID=A0A1C1CR23_9EURO|nr:hypothetical protein CLCR_08320 [Cladophialophora carrionii]